MSVHLKGDNIHVTTKAAAFQEVAKSELVVGRTWPQEEMATVALTHYANAEHKRKAVFRTVLSRGSCMD